MRWVQCARNIYAGVQTSAADQQGHLSVITALLPRAAVTPVSCSLACPAHYNSGPEHGAPAGDGHGRGGSKVATLHSVDAWAMVVHWIAAPGNAPHPSAAAGRPFRRRVWAVLLATFRRQEYLGHQS